MTKYHRHLHQKKRRVLVIKRQANFTLVDRLTYIAAVAEPVLTLPQVYVIFRDKTAAGVSITTWVGYEVFTLVWLWYGFTHKERVIIVYQSLFLLLQTCVIVGAYIYGGHW